MLEMMKMMITVMNNLTLTMSYLHLKRRRRFLTIRMMKNLLRSPKLLKTIGRMNLMMMIKKKARVNPKRYRVMTLLIL